jgi:hypothetical protein
VIVMADDQQYAILDLYDGTLKHLNARNPRDRKRLLDAQAALEARFDRAQHLVDTDAHMSGSSHSTALVRRRDVIDAQLNAVFQLLSESAFDTGICRAAACHAPAGDAYRFMGYCEDCFTHAQQGTAPERPIDSLPKPYIGSVFGSYERTTP